MDNKHKFHLKLTTGNIDNFIFKIQRLYVIYKSTSYKHVCITKSVCIIRQCMCAQTSQMVSRQFHQEPTLAHHQANLLVSPQPNLLSSLVHSRPYKVTVHTATRQVRSPIPLKLHINQLKRQVYITTLIPKLQQKVGRPEITPIIHVSFYATIVLLSM